MPKRNRDDRDLTTNNTKVVKSKKVQDNQLIHWTFTLHYENRDLEREFVKKTCIEQCKLYLFQTEVCPSTGRKHFQGTFLLKERRRMSELKKIFGTRMNFTPGDPKKGGWKGSIRYASKEETQDPEYCIETNMYIEQPPIVLSYEQLYPWQKYISDLADTEPDNRTIYWIYETEGNVGKTELKKYIMSKQQHRALMVEGKNADIKNAFIELKKKRLPMPSIVLLDVERDEMDTVPYAGLKKVKDGFFASGKFAGGQILMRSPHVFVFANFPPLLGKKIMSKDVIHIIHLNCNGKHEDDIYTHYNYGYYTEHRKDILDVYEQAHWNCTIRTEH